VRYPEVGVSVPSEIVSVGTLLGRALASGRARPGQWNAVYHDACHLARSRPERDDARAVARFLTGNDGVLPGVVGGAPDCCGASGSLPEAAPAAARAMAESVLDAAKARGADTLLTFSPRCAHHLRTIDPGFQVADPSRLLVRM